MTGGFGIKLFLMGKGCSARGGADVGDDGSFGGRWCAGFFSVG